MHCRYCTRGLAVQPSGLTCGASDWIGTKTVGLTSQVDVALRLSPRSQHPNPHGPLIRPRDLALDCSVSHVAAEQLSSCLSRLVGLEEAVAAATKHLQEGPVVPQHA